MFKAGELLYEGKAKKVFSVLENDQVCDDKVWLRFKDSLTAFNAQKTGSFENKGKVNLAITEIIFSQLHKNDLPTHWVKKVSETELVVKKLKMIPLEVVIRNILAGSTAKKFQIPNGQILEDPIYELFYKKDELNDPFINESQALFLKAVKDLEELKNIQVLGLKVNQVLKDIFKQVGIDLVDFKIEMGWDADGHLCLGDEISPDSCRLWDSESQKIMDKDRFRKDLGEVKDNYEEILVRLQKQFQGS